MSGGCGKPGHVTAGSDEGTQWCATCVNESDALAPYHVRYDVMVYHGDYRLCTCRNEMDAREIVEGMNATVKLRKLLREALTALNGEPDFNVSLRLDIEREIGP